MIKIENESYVLLDDYIEIMIKNKPDFRKYYR
jgi:hypothetical protein